MIKAIHVNEAVEILKANGFKVTVDRLRMGLIQRVYPFGDAVEMPGGSYCYAVYTTLLKKWIEERSEAE